MTDELPIVLLHGSATGSYSWAAVRMGVVQGIDYLEPRSSILEGAGYEDYSPTLKIVEVESVCEYQGE